MTERLDSMSVCSGFHSPVETHFICLNLARIQSVSKYNSNSLITRDNNVLLGYGCCRSL